MASITRLIELCRTSKQLFIALDRDGTLVPYAASPQEAIISPAARQALSDLSSLPDVSLALVSARSVALLKSDVDSDAIVLAGNYGMEILYPDGQEFVAPMALQAVATLKRIRQDLAHLITRFPGLILEDHGYSLCVHWQELESPRRKELLTLVKEQFDKEFGSVTLRMLPTSFEFLPKSNWNKANGLEAIAERLHINSQGHLVIFIGDSEQDEPGYVWANKRDGASVKIGKGGGRTQAQYSLEKPDKLAEFLQQVIVSRKDLPIESSEDIAECERKIEAAFKTLQADYATGLAQKIGDLELVIKAAANTGGDMSGLSESRMQLHRLKGTIGSYGFSEISSILEEIEASLRSIDDGQSDLDKIRRSWRTATPFIAHLFARAKTLAESAAAHNSPKD